MQEGYARLFNQQPSKSRSKLLLEVNQHVICNNSESQQYNERLLMKSMKNNNLQ